MTHRRCPACGASGGGPLVWDLALRTPDGHPLGAGYPVVSCAECGCGFADAVVASSYYDRYYASLAKYATEPGRVTGPAPEADWLAQKADASAERIAALVDGREARVLDLGCSTGSLLVALSRLGYHDLHGVDPSPASVEVAAARPGVEASVGTFASMPDIGSFDLVALTGVLEHLWDLDEALLAVRRLLRPGGTVYVEVPDASRYLEPYVAPFDDFSTEHVNHFSPSTLARLAARHGLVTVDERRAEADVAPGLPTALAVAAWRTGTAAGTPQGRDEALADSLARYAARSAADFTQIGELLGSELAGHDELVVWGIGETAFKLLALEPVARRRVRLYADANPARRALLFDGQPVVDPSEIPSGAIPVVVSSLIRADSIVAAAASLGLANPVVRLDRWRR